MARVRSPPRMTRRRRWLRRHDSWWCSGHRVTSPSTRGCLSPTSIAGPLAPHADSLAIGDEGIGTLPRYSWRRRRQQASWRRGLPRRGWSGWASGPSERARRLVLPGRKARIPSEASSTRSSLIAVAYRPSWSGLGATAGGCGLWPDGHVGGVRCCLAVVAGAPRDVVFVAALRALSVVVRSGSAGGLERGEQCSGGGPTLAMAEPTAGGFVSPGRCSDCPPRSGVAGGRSARRPLGAGSHRWRLS